MATPFKVVIGNWHKNTKVNAIKQQKSKQKGNEKVYRGNNLVHQVITRSPETRGSVLSVNKYLDKC
jgi:hypothetical protein